MYNTAFASCVCAYTRTWQNRKKRRQEEGDKREKERFERKIATINFQGLSGETVWFSLDRRPKDKDGMAERSNASSTSSLTLPPMPGASPDGGASPRRAVSPLLEVRRPHCTLNCESCSLFLEDIYRHSTCPLRRGFSFSSIVALRRDRIRYSINYILSVLTRAPPTRGRIHRSITPDIDLG